MVAIQSEGMAAGDRKPPHEKPVSLHPLKTEDSSLFAANCEFKDRFWLRAIHLRRAA